MGGLLAGVLAGYGEAHEKSNLLALEEEKERRRGLVQAYRDLANSPNIRPEAAMDLHNRILTIQGTPYNKKLPKELADITSYVIGMKQAQAASQAQPQSQPMTTPPLPQPTIPPPPGVDEMMAQPLPASVPTVSSGVTGELPGAQQTVIAPPPGLFYSPQEQAQQEGAKQAAIWNAREDAIAKRRTGELAEGRKEREANLKKLGIDVQNADPETKLRIAEYLEKGNIDNLVGKRDLITLPPGATLVDRTGKVVATGTPREAAAPFAAQVALDAYAQKLGKTTDQLTAQEKQAALKTMKTEGSHNTIVIPPGMTRGDVVQEAADRVKSGELTPQQAHSLLGGQKGGLGAELLRKLGNNRILPPKIREQLNGIDRAQSRIAIAEDLVSKIAQGKDVIKNSALLEAQVGQITAMLARANGEVGVLTEQDVNRAQSLLPQWKSANFAPEYARAMLDTLRDNQQAVKSAITDKYFQSYDRQGNIEAPPGQSSDRVIVEKDGKRFSLPKRQLQQAVGQGYKQVQ